MFSAVQYCTAKFAVTVFMASSTKKPRGRPSWVTGTKLDFLDHYSEDWQKSVDKGSGPAGLFYTKVTKRFIKKYGWYFDRWLGNDDVPDPEESTIDDEDSQDGVSPEEVAKRNVYYVDLRAVRHVPFFG